MIKIIRLIATLLIFNSSLCAAKSKALPLPRFAAIKSNEANARKGPGKNFPIEWVFVKKNEPVEIYREYEQWRQIRDINNEGGWVHVSVLSNKRSIVIIGKETVSLTKTQSVNSKVVAKLSPSLRCSLIKCELDFCKIKCDRYVGWVKKLYLWGVYQNEVL